MTCEISIVKEALFNIRSILCYAKAEKVDTQTEMLAFAKTKTVLFKYLIGKQS